MVLRVLLANNALVVNVFAQLRVQDVLVASIIPARVLPIVDDAIMLVHQARHALVECADAPLVKRFVVRCVRIQATTSITVADVILSVRQVRAALTESAVVLLVKRFAVGSAKLQQMTTITADSVALRALLASSALVVNVVADLQVRGVPVPPLLIPAQALLIAENAATCVLEARAVLTECVAVVPLVKHFVARRVGI